MKATRHRATGVLPLELWDVMVGARPLYEIPQAELGEALADTAEQLREGRARRLRAGAPLPRLDFDRIVLAGGGELDAAATSLRARGFAASKVEDPHWIAERGGRALLETLCDPALGAVLDVGQTALKYSDARGRTRWERPLDLVPLEVDARARGQAATFRANTLAFLAEPLRRAPPLSGLVLALPCEVDDELRVAGCSYPWRAGDRHLIADLIQRARLEQTPCLVLNDAELAAVSVACEEAAPGRTLVLTLGLGLGAALVTRGSSQDGT